MKMKLSNQNKSICLYTAGVLFLMASVACLCYFIKSTSLDFKSVNDYLGFCGGCCLTALLMTAGISFFIFSDNSETKMQQMKLMYCKIELII